MIATKSAWQIKNASHDTSLAAYNILQFCLQKQLDFFLLVVIYLLFHDAMKKKTPTAFTGYSQFTQKQILSHTYIYQGIQIMKNYRTVFIIGSGQKKSTFFPYMYWQPIGKFRNTLISFVDQTNFLLYQSRTWKLVDY